MNMYLSAGALQFVSSSLYAPSRQSRSSSVDTWHLTHGTKSFLSSHRSSWKQKYHWGLCRRFAHTADPSTEIDGRASCNRKVHYKQDIFLELCHSVETVYKILNTYPKSACYTLWSLHLALCLSFYYLKYARFIHCILFMSAESSKSDKQAYSFSFSFWIILFNSILFFPTKAIKFRPKTTFAESILFFKISLMYDYKTSLAYFCGLFTWLSLLSPLLRPEIFKYIYTFFVVF